MHAPLPEVPSLMTASEDEVAAFTEEVLARIEADEAAAQGEPAASAFASEAGMALLAAWWDVVDLQERVADALPHLDWLLAVAQATAAALPARLAVLTALSHHTGLARQVMRPTPESFEEYEIDRALIDYAEQGERQAPAAEAPDFAYAAAAARLALRARYGAWLAQGGSAEALPEEASVYLEALRAQGVPALEAAIEAARAEGAPALVAARTRALAAHHEAQHHPNEAVRLRQALIDYLAPLPDPALEGQRGEAHKELALLYAHFQKWARALPHFEAAERHFDAAGPAYENELLIAEGWAEECRAHLG